MPMHFTVMDLTGKSKPLPQGQQYAFTTINLLKDYTWCIPLFTKEVDKVVHAYFSNF